MSEKHGGTTLSALLLALVLAACNGGDGGGDDGANPIDVTPPTIVSTLPVDGGSGVARTTAVTVTFNEAVTPAAVGAATLSLTAGALPVTGTVTIDGPLVTFTPSA
ncbi:MAG TPA: Ig-like domain-containing protein, partial [Desulfuromonadales bacterium]|nr:Ig-like domain-containing protein [Desulfuromonadales bacterium]